MTNPATSFDLQARSFRTLADGEVAIGGQLLEDAYTLIVSRVPSSVARLSDATFRALVIQIQCAMVLRVLKNPDGKLEETIDDYRWRRDSAVSSGDLYLSDAEADLLGAGDGQSEGAWSINIRSHRRVGWWVRPDMWEPEA